MNYKTRTLIALNIFLDKCFCDPYLPINGQKARNFFPEVFDDISEFESNNDKLYYLLDNFIYNNANEVNEIFYKYIRDSADLGTINNEKLFVNFKKLVDYSKSLNIPIIRFPPLTNSEDSFNPLLGVNRRINKTNFILDARKDMYFIMFVDQLNNRLKDCNIEPANEFTNYLSHEIGHCIDPTSKKRPTDFILGSDEYYKYRFKREEDAWEIAKTIQRKFGISDTQIDSQAKKSLSLYSEFFFGN